MKKNLFLSFLTLTLLIHNVVSLCNEDDCLSLCKGQFKKSTELENIGGHCLSKEFNYFCECYDKTTEYNLNFYKPLNIFNHDENFHKVKL